jgi:serine phosphatase RsbU (regulator of sigma subunit)
MSARWDILSGNLDRDRQNVGILLESVEEFFGSLDPGELARRVVDRAIRVTRAQRGILLLEDGRDGIQATVARSAEGRDLPKGFRFSRSAVERVRSTGQPFRIVDPEDPAALNPTQSIVALKLLSVMAVPLPVQGRSLGVLYVDSTINARDFGEADLVLFRMLGGLIALAVENGRLVAERVVKERMARELTVAREIQAGLFPKVLPALTGFEIAAEGRPCEETSGDYYDVIPLPDGRVVVVVGDVSGHGLGPALWMTSTRAFLHALVRAVAAPAEMMGALNEFLERDLPDASFVSLFVGLLDPGSRTLHFVNAGHPPGLLRRAGGALEELSTTGRVLGMFRDAAYRVGGPVELRAGDALVLYTDGITEARRPDGEMYGEERFVASLSARCRATRGAGDLLRGMLDDLAAWTSTRAPTDDITCLVLRAR